MVLACRNRLLKVRRAERQERSRLQLAEVVPEPYAAESRRHGEHRDEARQNVARAELGLAALVNRGGEEEDEVEDAHQEHEHRDAAQAVGPALQGAREQKRERQREVKKNYQKAHRLPAAVQTPQVERNLFGRVPRPRYQELREGEVSVAHHDRQGEFLTVVQVQRLVGVPQRLLLRKERPE